MSCHVVDHRTQWVLLCCKEDDGVVLASVDQEATEALPDEWSAALR